MAAASAAVVGQVGAPARRGGRCPLAPTHRRCCRHRTAGGGPRRRCGGAAGVWRRPHRRRPAHAGAGGGGRPAGEHPHAQRPLRLQLPPESNELRLPVCPKRAGRLHRRQQVRHRAPDARGQAVAGGPPEAVRRAGRPPTGSGRGTARARRSQQRARLPSAGQPRTPTGAPRAGLPSAPAPPAGSSPPRRTSPSAWCSTGAATTSSSTSARRSPRSCRCSRLRARRGATGQTSARVRARRAAPRRAPRTACSCCDPACARLPRSPCRTGCQATSSTRA